jgi:hypothetical protein
MSSVTLRAFGRDSLTVFAIVMLVLGGYLSFERDDA